MKHILLFLAAASLAIAQSFPVKTNAGGAVTEPANLLISGALGGTGVANTGKTVTLGGNLTTSGAFGLVLTLTGNTTVTLPTSGTLSTLAGAEVFTNKSINLANNTLTATSAQVATSVTDETGTGNLVFSTSPTLVTPNIGAATGTSVNLSGNGTFGGNLTVSGTGLSSVAGALNVTGALLAHQTAALNMAHEGSSLSQLVSYGADASTYGRLNVTLRKAGTGVGAVTALALTSTDATFGGNLTTGSNSTISASSGYLLIQPTTTLYLRATSGSVAIADAGSGTVSLGQPGSTTTVQGNLTVSGSTNALGGTNTGNSEVLALRGSGTTAQLRIAGAGADYVKYLALGFNTTSNYGWIDANQAGTGVKPLVVNPSGGNLLLGTTTDTGEKLQVNGTGYFAGALIQLGNATVDALYRVSASNGKSSDFGDDTTGGFVRANNSQSLRFITAGNIVLTLDSSANATFAGSVTVSGNISSNAVFGSSSGTLYLRPNGISVASGQATIDTSGNLTVSGTGGVTSSGTTWGFLSNNATQNGYAFYASGASADQKYWHWQNGSAVGDGTLRLRALNDALTNGTNALIITRTGISSTAVEVGGNLTVSGNGLNTFGGTGATNASILFGANNIANASAGYLSISQRLNYGFALFGYNMTGTSGSDAYTSPKNATGSAGVELIGGSLGITRFIYSTAATTAGNALTVTEAARFSSGNLLLGTTSDNSLGKLQVNGNINLPDYSTLNWGNGTISIQGAPSGGIFKVFTNGGTALTIDSSQNATLVGNLTVSGTGGISIGSATFTGGRALTATTGSGNSVSARLLQTGVADWEIKNVATTGRLAFQQSSTDYLQLTSTGNLLIGTAVDSSGLLQVGTNTTTAAGGMKFGTDVSVYRSGTRELTFLAASTPTFVFAGTAVGSTTTIKLGDGTNNDQGVIESQAGSLVFKRNAFTALTLDSSQNAIFSATTDSTSTSTGALQVSGGVGIAKTLTTTGRILTTTVKTANYTVATTDHVVVCNSASTFTVTLIAASTNTGRHFIVKNKGAGTVTVDATSLGQIDGVNTITLGQYQSTTLVSDGTTWNRI